jgi:hypothetical protein
LARDIIGLADSDFSFMPLSNTVVSGDIWGGLSSALLLAAAASTTLNTNVQTEITARFSFISFCQRQPCESYQSLNRNILKAVKQFFTKPAALKARPAARSTRPRVAVRSALIRDMDPTDTTSSGWLPQDRLLSLMEAWTRNALGRILI